MVSRSLAMMVAAVLMIDTGFACIVGGTGMRPMCERFWQYEAVALVDIVAIEKRQPLNRRYVTLRTVEIFRGSPPGEITFADPETDCGVNFSRTGRQLVWLFQEHGKWRAFGEEDFKNEASDIAFARSMRENPPRTAYVFGTVGRPNHKEIVMAGPPSMSSPLEGALVVADRGGTRYEARVDKAGNFKLSDVPPGTYQVNVDRLPPNMEGDPQEIELHGGACKEMHLRPDTSGEISGYLVPGGKMPEHAFVFLRRIPSDPSEDNNYDVRNGLDVFADDETGAFSFRHVSPGQYVLSFSNQWQGPSADIPYETRYYPNSKTRSSAEVLSLADGQKIRGLRFDLGPEAKKRTIRIQASWHDGTPAPNLHVQLRNVKEASNLPDAQYTDESGHASLVAFADFAYQLEAAGRCEEASPKVAYILNNIPVRVEDKRVLPNRLIMDSDASVIITVPGSKCALGRPWYGADDD